MCGEIVMDDIDFDKAIERMKNFIDNRYKSGKLPMFKVTADEQGRSYEDNYYVQCLNCGRCVLVGKCCDNRVTQSMIDKLLEDK